MQPNIPESDKKRILIVGAGFGGLSLARKLASKGDVQVVLLDKNNYHQFQPLFYQVATAGLEPSAITFPLRKIFQKNRNVHIRTAAVLSVDSSKQMVKTTIGEIRYDYLVLAMGADTTYYGMNSVKEKAIPMKSVSEALGLRNHLLQNFEDALVCSSEEEMEAHMTIVVVGGGPTGTEVSGTLAEMKKTVLPKDFPELSFEKMNIILVEGSPKILGPMSNQASTKAQEYLLKLGVTLKLSTHVKDFDGERVYLSDGSQLRSKTLIWAAGVVPNTIEGFNKEVYTKGNRMQVDRFNRVMNTDSVFAIGDIAFMKEDKFPNGHPQMAQPAIQQGEHLAKNIRNDIQKRKMEPFTYNDKGSMATIGRNLAVVDLPFWKFQGFFAWLVWMLVHLMSILGVKNRLFIFINWCWSYITFDQSLRLIIKPKSK